MTRIEIALARFGKEEGVRPFAYDDSTGKRVTCKPAGNLTIAEGINLETGLDIEEIAWLTSHRLTLTDAALRKFAWYALLDEPRGSVFLDVAFNSGITGLLHFPRMILAAQIKNWTVAAQELLDSEAARAAPSRYRPLADILRAGA